MAKVVELFTNVCYNYTQEDLAEKLGVSRQAVSRWESGETTPELVLLKGICHIFNVSADYMINDDAENEKDIPVTRTKDAKIKNVKSIKKTQLLISCISFAICYAFSWAGVIMSNNNLQLVISLLIMGCSTAATLIMFATYIRMCKHD